MENNENRLIFEDVSQLHDFEINGTINNTDQIKKQNNL
jgi:hypothetical protein